MDLPLSCAQLNVHRPGKNARQLRARHAVVSHPKLKHSDKQPINPYQFLRAVMHEKEASREQQKEAEGTQELVPDPWQQFTGIERYTEPSTLKQGREAAAPPRGLELRREPRAATIAKEKGGTGSS